MAATVWTRKSRGGKWGPWHQGSHYLTLCGRRMPGICSFRNDPPPAGQRRCAKCEKNAAAGTQTPYRRH